VPPRPQVPRYLQVADDLRMRVERGDFERGVALPSAAEFGRQYNVSQRTAHRAVRVLVDDGLLVVSPNYGTFLA